VDVIDLRSDTLTKPTAGMRKAIAAAEVGDEQKGEDPTVIALEQRVAELLGMDIALFVPSATMANQIALRVLGRPGDELLAERHSHVFLYELGGPAVHGGLVMKPIDGKRGLLEPDDLDDAFSPPAWYHSTSRVVSLENTHAESGGRAWPSEQLRSVAARARELGLRVHLDGARLFNAAAATGTTPREFAEPFDTVTVCLSKGLGCPVGALVAGRADALSDGRRWKQLFGGAMRQAGMLAAAGLYALDNHVERLGEDHANARRLAAAAAAAGLPIDNDPVESNMVLIDVRPLGLEASAALGRLEAVGVRLSSLERPGILRAVTHLDVDTAQIDVAGERLAAALVGSP
jgi:threonine aldolase